MDNASYHSVVEDKIPNRSWRKGDIQEWLFNKDLFFEENYTVRELLDVVEKNKPAVKFVIDEMAREAGIIVRRLPPYHCELNPIEMVWSQVKRYVASNNTTFKLAAVEKLVYEAFEQVTPKQWANYEDRVVKLEKEMAELENLQDAVVDTFIIRPYDSSSEEEEEEEHYSNDDEDGQEGITPIP